MQWSGDSKSLLASALGVDGKTGIFRIDLATGSATLLFEAPFVPVFASSPDGGTIYYRPRQGPVLARNLSSGLDRTLFATQGTVNGLHLSRSGAKLAVLRGTSLTIVDTETGAATVRWSQEADSRNRIAGGAWSPDDRSFTTVARVASSGPRHAELWTFNVAGGDPMRQRVPTDFRGVSMSADGRQLAMMRWEHIGQLWTLENFLPPPAK